MSNEVTSPEMQIITIGQMKDVMTHVMVGENEVPMFEGKSGIGKTVGAEQWCATNNAFYLPFLCSQYDSVDFRGTPWTTALDAMKHIFPEVEHHDLVSNMSSDEEDDIVWGEDETEKLKKAYGFPEHWKSGKISVREPEVQELATQKKFTVWHPASTLPFKGNPLFPTDRPIVLFFDEISSAKLDVMAILYQLIDKRCVGEHELMDNVYIMCAGNRAEDKGIVNRMPLPLCNRLVWFGVTLDLEGWAQYMSEKYGAPINPFVAYFRWKKGNLHTFAPENPRRVFCSPRTAEKAGKFFISSTMPPWLKQASMAGTIGSGVNDEVWSFLTIWKGVELLMEDIKKNPTTANIPDEPSVKWAVALSISGLLTCKNANNYYKYLKRMETEYCIASWQMAVAREEKAKRDGRMPVTAPNLFESDPFIDMAIKYKAIFNRR